MISHSHRCIFVHIPKTAGNSINRVFGISWQDHKDLQRYRAELPAAEFDSYFKFAIVRNPWDRLLSDYNYQVKKSRARDSKLYIYDERGHRRGFASWIEQVFCEPARYAPKTWGGDVSAHIHRWSPQVDWISVDDRIAVERVVKLEDLSTEFPLLAQQLDLPVKRLPHRNGRLHWHYSHYYDRATRDLVAQYYARDIAAFDYEFEDKRLTTVAVRWIRRSPMLASAPVVPVAEMKTPASPTLARATPPRRRRNRLSFALAGACIGMLGLAGFHGATILNRVGAAFGRHLKAPVYQQPIYQQTSQTAAVSAPTTVTAGSH